MKYPYKSILILNVFLALMFVISCEDKKPDEIETVLDWKNLNLAEDWQTGKINVEGIDTESLESLLWYHCCGIIAVESLLWNHCCGIIAMESLLWNHCCGIIEIGRAHV